MKYTLATFALAAFVAAGHAQASSDKICTNAPRSDWMSVEAVKARLTDMGYDVRRIKADDGCYEVYAIDKSGNKVEAHVDPATAKVVKAKIDD